MNTYIKNLLEKKINLDSIEYINNLIYKSKFEKLKNKIKLRINLLGYKVIKVLKISNKLINSNILNKENYMNLGKPLFPKKIKLNKKSYESELYKLKIVESNNKSNISITYYIGGCVIYDNNKPRHSIIYNIDK
tara:strand:+ start:271 stop:672 length:402 start_codon:yes stop_codon:yes gene_type:complete